MEVFRSIFAESSSDSEADDKAGEQLTLTTSSSSIADTSFASQHKQQTIDPAPFQTNPPVGRKWQSFASFSTPLPLHPPVLPPSVLPPPPAPHPVFHESKKALAAIVPLAPEEVSE